MEHCPDTVLFRTTTGGFRGWAVLVGPHDAEILHKKILQPRNEQNLRENSLQTQGKLICEILRIHGKAEVDTPRFLQVYLH